MGCRHRLAVLGLGCGERLFLLLFQRFLALAEEHIGQLLRGHLEQVEAGELLLHSGIIDRLGMQLLLDVILQAHLLHGLDVAGPGAKGDAVKDVDDLLAACRGAGKAFLGPSHVGAEKNDDSCH